MARSRRTTQAEDEGTPRVSLGGRAARTEDETCKVRVYVTGCDPKTNKPLPNNITKTLYINDSTVTEAADTILAAF